MQVFDRELLNCISHMAWKLSTKKFQDFANTNNNLNEKLSAADRHAIAAIFSSDVAKIEVHLKYIREIFETV